MSEENENTTPRDTQFIRFANLLYTEMCVYGAAHPDIEEATPYLEIIARRAYDLAVHVIHMHSAIESENRGRVLTPADVLREMPDLTKLPEETK